MLNWYQVFQILVQKVLVSLCRPRYRVENTCENEKDAEIHLGEELITSSVARKNSSKKNRLVITILLCNDRCVFFWC